MNEYHSRKHGKFILYMVIFFMSIADMIWKTQKKKEKNWKDREYTIYRIS